MLGLLPWEKWIPPYILGPAMCTGSIAVLVFSSHLSWWWWIILPSWALYCAWGTWHWFKYRRNVFDPPTKSK